MSKGAGKGKGASPVSLYGKNKAIRQLRVFVKYCKSILPYECGKTFSHKCEFIERAEGACCNHTS